MTDQAFSLRKKAWEANRNAHYISVSSGKGGVGKTNFCVNLAYFLAKMGKKVLVFDADLGLANVDILLSVQVNVTIKKYLAGEASVEDILKKGVYGFDVFPASSGFMELANLTEDDFEKIFSIFINLDGFYDYIIFDTGAGISETVTKFASVADSVIVVTQPEPTAITDAYAFIKVIKKTYEINNISLVFNRVDSLTGAETVFRSLQGVVHKFLNVDVNLLGYIRDDKTVRASVRAQKPVAVFDSKAEFAQDVAQCARRITGEPTVKKKGGVIYNLFKGVFK